MDLPQLMLRPQHSWVGCRKGKMLNIFERLSEAKLKVRLFVLRCPVGLGSYPDWLIATLTVLLSRAFCTFVLPVTNIWTQCFLVSNQSHLVTKERKCIFSVLQRAVTWKRTFCFQILMCQRPCYQIVWLHLFLYFILCVLGCFLFTYCFFFPCVPSLAFSSVWSCGTSQLAHMAKQPGIQISEILWKF